MIYVIPDFQNPSGRTWPLERRKQFMEIINKYEIPVVEDNPYGELRVSGEDVPAIKSFDEDGIVIYAGSFSKVLSPGMRIGWFVAPKEVAAKMIVCKQGSDVHTTAWSQIVASEFMTKYDFEAHLERLREIYRKKI